MNLWITLSYERLAALGSGRNFTIPLPNPATAGPVIREIQHDQALQVPQNGNNFLIHGLHDLV